MSFKKYFSLFFCLLLASFALPLSAQTAVEKKTGVFIRFKILDAIGGERFTVSIGGFRHDGEPWQFPDLPIGVVKGQWTGWIDLSGWKWHGRQNRSGGIAEWNSLKLVASASEGVSNLSIAVEMTDAAGEKPLVSFIEKSESNTVAFLAPYPLRENIKEFETGSQMTARHLRWAHEATGGKHVQLKKFEFITALWGHYDPALERSEIDALQLLGFGNIGNITPAIAREKQIKTYGVTWLYAPDPQTVETEWKKFAAGNINSPVANDKWRYETMRHWVIADEVSGLDLSSVEPEKVNNWFREYLKNNSVTAKDLGKPVETIEFPAKILHEPFLPENESLPNRKIFYHAAKFNQFWSVKQMRQISDLVRVSLPNVKTETLLPSHGFFGNAWGPANVGMSYRMLDIFELGRQQSVNQLSVEDWFGLNHMYWSDYTWTGGQTFGYYNALVRSGIGAQPIEMRALITPSDNEYLQLKAYSAIGQGAKSIFFWTFAPTYIGTENYWSDLRSEYDGIARLGRALEKSEDVIYPAKPVSDQVAVVYSVSHDIWNTDNHTSFVEKRLLWHALKHLQIQPNFLSEESIAAGSLSKYKVLYLTDWLVSRNASKAIDAWVKAGGVLYLSAGAALRDEFNEPYQPPFAEIVWGKNAAQNFVSEHHSYNERKDLPTIKPLTTVKINLGEKSFALPAIGARANLASSQNIFAVFADGKTAAARFNYGRGQIIAVGFLPMLAYGQSAGFKPATLEEKWQPEPREIVKLALDAAGVQPVVKSNVPVVQADLLAGENGSAVVLANYTYQPIKALTLDVRLSKNFSRAASVEGSKIQTSKLPDGKVRLILPLKWTDIILLN